jgi:hypothetical protein
MQCILERFVVIARAHGAVPILLFLPGADRARPQPYQDFVARLQASLTDVTIVDIAKEPFDPRRFGITPEASHPSRYGNQVIAAAVYRAIEHTMER